MEQTLVNGIADNLLHNIFNDLELYDKDGLMIDVNYSRLRSMGIKDKKDILGYNLFNYTSFSDEIKEQIRNKKYSPKPVKRVEIPKPDGGVRNLGVPTVVDRFVQQAIAQVLTPIYEPKFSESSYGFRPNRCWNGNSKSPGIHE